MKFWSRNMEAAGYTCMNGSTRGSGSVSLSTSPSGPPLARYANQQSDDYLTPTSPLSPQPPKLPDFPHSFAQLHPKQGSSRNQQFGRADSGIEVDCPRSPLSSTSTSNPRASTLYEYIDPVDVKLQESRHNVTVSQGESASSGVSSTGTTATRSAYSGDAISDTEDGRIDSNGVRRRANPMYEALEKSATRLYAQTCHCKLQSSAHKQLRYLWCAFIVIIIITIFLLAVISYMLFQLIPDLQSQQQTQEDRIQQIESKYAKFFQETSSLHQFTTGNASDPESVMYMIRQLNKSVTTINFHLDEVNTDLHMQIQNISLTPGPQGPPGVGNLSSCHYTKKTTSTAVSSGYFKTAWQPDGSTLQDHIVMSASCEVVNGTQQSLETLVNSTSNKVQYRCRCGGEPGVHDTKHTSCTIHLMICPLLSTFET
ncbi:uncharacterized protein [Littorina saxatilis]|uniref:Uncharacterized protein n=1 Tax=Littorina saxatilis TaxID=31220 RepID=A0AAN9BFY6_9CAEN